jgi:hypothetical protein
MRSALLAALLLIVGSAAFLFIRSERLFPKVQQSEPTAAAHDSPLQEADDSPTPPPDDAAPYSWTNNTQELDILEAVFRYQFEHNASVGTQTKQAKHLYLALGSARAPIDPPAELLARFAGNSPPVEPVSAADLSGLSVRHKTDGEPGVIFRIERLRPVQSEVFDVDGGYWEAGESSSGNTYRVRLRQGSWTVTAAKMWWIS